MAVGPIHVQGGGSGGLTPCRQLAPSSRRECREEFEFEFDCGFQL